MLINGMVIFTLLYGVMLNLNAALCIVLFLKLSEVPHHREPRLATKTGTDRITA